MKMIRSLVRKLRLDTEEGQGLVEYGLILGLVTVVAFAAYTNFGRSATNLIQKVGDSVSTAS